MKNYKPSENKTSRRVMIIACATALVGGLAASIAARTRNGAAGQMRVLYEGDLFTVNLKELSATASNSTIANNRSVNNIYVSNDLDDEQDFFPVIDAIQGDGFNPLWHQILIVFNPGFSPHQFFSGEEILAAAAETNPEITLVNTGEVYRCAVVGA